MTPDDPETWGETALGCLLPALGIIYAVGVLVWLLTTRH